MVRKLEEFLFSGFDEGSTFLCEILTPFIISPQTSVAYITLLGTADFLPIGKVLFVILCKVTLLTVLLQKGLRFHKCYPGY